MYSSRLFQLLVLAVSVFCIAQATWRDSVHHMGRDMLPPRRDESSGSASQSDAQQSSTAASSASSTTSSTTTTTQTSTTSTPASSSSSSQSPTSQPSSTSPTSTTAASHTTPSASSSTTQSSKKTSSSKVTAKTTHKTTTATPVVSTTMAVVTTTNSKGQKETMTTAVKTTTTPGLNAQSDNGTSGMSTQTRNTIIGVVVGVGGAFVLGALGLVAWRIWGRRKHAEESDGLMAYNGGYSGIEKNGPGSSNGPTGGARTPFQSTLDHYHEPGSVTASSNF